MKIVLFFIQDEVREKQAKYSHEIGKGGQQIWKEHIGKRFGQEHGDDYAFDNELYAPYNDKEITDGNLESGEQHKQEIHHSSNEFSQEYGEDYALGDEILVDYNDLNKNYSENDVKRKQHNREELELIVNRFGVEHGDDYALDSEMIAGNNNQSNQKNKGDDLESGEQRQEKKLKGLNLVRFQLRQGQGDDYALDYELYTGQNNTNIQENKDNIEENNEQSKEQKQKNLDLEKFQHLAGHRRDYALQNELLIGQNRTNIQNTKSNKEKSNEKNKEQKQKDLNLVNFELRQEHEAENVLHDTEESYEQKQNKKEFDLADEEFGQEYGDDYASVELELVQDEFGQEHGQDYANDDLFLGNIQAIIGITVCDGIQKKNKFSQ